ncbi:GNAT family N-acetyltransferase [Bradyrhizobium sp. BWA-3-5]|uniref:GNAT family N-acetyltransferase n=1 Tax=Bradyrhizobium sp. BWA-3-5 TaxID=3080013 RepID=UPI00293E84F4|nr:GNAT family N-acetyltransferase [Bradyrhizobium sp. BWA-3-5]WOH63885.1 GNAT family N-acetyltransferase [Bradyrhizobium sp. BWA-3-5]
MQISIVETTLENVLHARHELLRPDHLSSNDPFEFTLSSADLSEVAIHLLASANGQTIGTLSAGPEYCPFKPSNNSWRSRGLGVHRDMRKQGIATALMKTVILKAHKRGASAVWGNPLVSVALHACKHLGYEAIGEQYDIPPFGGHQNMICYLTDELISFISSDRIGA